jgi:hypothetical protein
VPDSALLHSVVDGYLVVVAGRATPRKLLGEALSQLKPPKVIGLVYNRDDKPWPAFYRSRYHQFFQTSSTSAHTGDDNAW